MHFKIISVGWEPGRAMYKTLRSIETQSHRDWEVHVVDDGSSQKHQAELVEFCKKRDFRWGYTLQKENRGAVRNQYEGVREMLPDDEDVIVFLDLDGDRFAHRDVLKHLTKYYEDDTLVTYGSYQPDPPEKGFVCPVSPYPDDVVAAGSYRQNTRYAGTRYNHLRTVKWKVLKEIPQSYFMFSGDEWIFSPADLIVMMGALELAGGRYKCIRETLVIYNAQQPHPDNMRNPDRNVRGAEYTLSLPPLERLTNV